MTDALERVLARLEAEQLTTPDVFRRVTFAAGERFIAQGEPDTTVYLITAGSVRVTRHDDGHTEELARLDAPTIVGELAAFSQGRTADVTAQSPVEGASRSTPSPCAICAGKIRSSRAASTSWCGTARPWRPSTRTSAPRPGRRRRSRSGS